MAKIFWTKEQIEDFQTWHDKRLAELGYPQEIVNEFVMARNRWMPPMKGKYGISCASKESQECPPQRLHS